MNTFMWRGVGRSRWAPKRRWLWKVILGLEKGGYGKLSWAERAWLWSAILGPESGGSWAPKGV
eukprot:11360348-Alexandrium_andersonii.AAC.1